MDREALRRAYEALGDRTPMLTDCGLLCGAACCRPDADGQIYETGETPGEKFVYLGIVRGTDPAGRAVIEQKNKFAVGDALELMKPDGRNVRAVVHGLYDAAGTAIPDAPHPKQELHLELEAATAEEGDILRKSNIGDGDFC